MTPLDEATAAFLLYMETDGERQLKLGVSVLRGGLDIAFLHAFKVGYESGWRDAMEQVKNDPQMR